MAKQKGFTLIEVLVVVLILGILVTIALPMFQDAKNKAKCAELYTTVSAIDKGLKLYYLENNAYVNIPLISGTNGTDTGKFSSILGVDILETDRVFEYWVSNAGSYGVIVVILKKDSTAATLCAKLIGGSLNGRWAVNNKHSWARYLSIPADLQI